MKRQTVRNNDVGYSKLYSKNSDEDDEGTELLFIRKPKNVFKEVPTIEKILEEGDTLQALSIRYRCSIAELKRLNNIDKDNEIFARNKIKVPAKPFSMAIAGVHDSGNSSPNDKILLPEIDTVVLQDKLKETLNGSLESEFNAVIFNSSLATRSNDAVEDVEDEEDVSLIPNEPVPVVVPLPRTFSCSGADADISWIALIITIVVLIVAVPIIYTVYIAEHLEKYHHHKHS